MQRAAVQNLQSGRAATVAQHEDAVGRASLQRNAALPPALQKDLPTFGTLHSANGRLRGFLIEAHERQRRGHDGSD
jgi:hypothetical protein